MHLRINVFKLIFRIASFSAALLLISSAQAAPAAPSGAQTALLQQGASSYSGVTDTSVTSQGWANPPQYTLNYGQSKTLTVGRGGNSNLIIAFDLSAIPPNSSVISATLSLNSLTPGGGNCITPGTQVRRINLFRMVKNWDEGNQNAGPINAAGKHGATGQYAFQYFTGEGTNIAWAGLGLQAGSDYAPLAESFSDVLNPGWYTWDISALARAWVRGELPNYGAALVDESGYSASNCDYREFASSQALNQAQRPILRIRYNPDVPYANAGPDQEILTWDGSALTLDGSASHDRPGGDDASLTYTWKIATPAYGSQLAAEPAQTAKAAFTPDIPGEWDLQLTVTNNLGESASDSVHLRILKLSAAHPRLYLTPARLAFLKTQAVPANQRWTQLLAAANQPTGDMQAKALVYQITGQTAYCTAAINQALQIAASPNYNTSTGGNMAVVYDWCYSQLSPAQRSSLIGFFNAWADSSHVNDVTGWGNYWPGYAYSYALMGLASYGDAPRAKEWIDEYRYRRYAQSDQILLNAIADGGAWPEGMVYDWIANYPRLKTISAWLSATGENLFESSPWYRNRLNYLLLHRWPGQASQWGFIYHPYQSTGDSERFRGSLTNYERIMQLILVEQYPADTAALQTQAYLSSGPTANSMSFLYHEEFLFYNPNQASAAPTPTSHYAPATGTIFLRSGWPDGALDNDTSVTYLTFQSGDHFTYHQHYDQNSFTLFKYADLALDAGVYSGNGLSYHDVNYYVRTIAHNTLVVYNPAENLTDARPDAVSNDGGQRTMYPASRTPPSLDYFNQYKTQYDTGDMLHYEDQQLYTYALGDATNAYNNPAYNQALDTSRVGNTAKVSRFQREFVYLRPAGALTNNDFLVLYDRVGVTQAAFSGQNTKLLFHVFAQPTVNGTPTAVSAGETLYSGSNLATTVNAAGKLFIRSLLPAVQNTRLVGGAGQKSFWVFGQNYDWHWSPGEPQPRPISDYDAVPYGEWRLEIEPADSALEHNFLNVLFPTSASTAAMPASSLVSAGNMNGTYIADPSLGRLVLFSSAADGSAPAGAISYTYTPITHTLNLLVDLTPAARYDLQASLLGGQQNVTLTPSTGGQYIASKEGVLSFILNFSGTQPLWQKVFLPFIH